MVPAIVRRTGRELDIFYPCTIGVEYIGEFSFQKLRRNSFKYQYRLYLKRLMIKGLKKTKKILTTEVKYSGNNLEKLGLAYERINIPMLYNKEIAINDENLKPLINQFKQYDLVIFCYVSHVDYKTKRPFLEGFQKFVSQNNGNSVLVFVEYGNDTATTRKIVLELGIEKNIVWISPLSRKQIMILLQHVHLGVSEFEGLMWGGTGWEFLASGVPFFHYFQISEEEFSMEYNCPMPPIFNSISPDYIADNLKNISENKCILEKFSNEMQEWFDKYGGIGLAQKWKDLIIEIHSKNNEIIQ
jgi:hypothetical protein